MKGRFVQSGAVSVRSLPDNGLILFQADNNRERVLNESGAFIWSQLSLPTTAETTAAALAGEFEVSPEDALVDVREYLRLLAEEGFVETNPSPSHSPFPIAWEAAPTHVDIAITGKCNLACKYCFFAKEMETREDLPTKAWLTFFYELERCAVRSVCLSGGEVFIRPDIFELIDGIVEARLRYSILSNGGLIDSDVIKKLSDNKRRKRLNSIQISLDGASAEVHDSLRGEGSFESALFALRALKEAGLPITCRVTIHKHNLEDLPQLAALLLDDIGLPSFSTNEAAALGSCREEENIQLSPKERLRAMELLVPLSAQYQGRVTAQGGPLALYRIFKEMEAAKAGKIPTLQHMGYLSGCGCPNSRLSINHDGTIAPCALLSQEVMGTIETTDLSELWLTSTTRQRLLERMKVKQRDLPYCQDCNWTEFCSGGCPATIYNQSGEINKPNEQQCYRRFIAAVGELPIFGSE